MKANILVSNDPSVRTNPQESTRKILNEFGSAGFTMDEMMYLVSIMILTMDKVAQADGHKKGFIIELLHDYIINDADDSDMVVRTQQDH